MMRDALHVIAACAAACASLAMAGCGPSGDDDGCSERSLGAVFSRSNNLGAMFPFDADDSDVSDDSRVPYEWTVLLRTECAAPVTIDKVCLVGANGAADAPAVSQFLLEGPTATEVTSQEDAAVRLTYNRRQPGGVDNVALLVESNAADFPTLVIPVCARVVENGAERGAIECTTPVPVPAAGEAASASCPE
jgi:hypothetical protein